MVKCYIDDINMATCLDVAVDDTTYQLIHMSCKIQDQFSYKYWEYT